jgi:hypothetical protein
MRTKANMVKWGFNEEDDTCDCGKRKTDDCNAPRLQYNASAG